jgi:DNA-binding response OmpR family regulator
MGSLELQLIIFTFMLIAIFTTARWLYIRSMRIKNRVQMSYLFTNITHELLTPLTILSASVERLRAIRPEGKQEYDLMDLNIQRTVRLLQQILETSKSQAGELKLLVSNGDVMRYIMETARCIEPLMSSKNHVFTISCHPESMMGWIDTDKLDKIIFNLLSNAAKYTNPNGRVALDVTTNKRYDHIIIRVSDNGNGIPKDKMKNLFTRFYDGDYRRSQTTGTGLGLSLTRDLVYLHGGNIHCDSIEGQGTTFIVDLPINKEAFTPTQIDEKNRIMADIQHPSHPVLPDTLSPVESANIPVEPLAAEGSHRILIVEDNIELLLLMRQLLQSKYRIMTATNGVEALDVIRNNKIDLIVSDVMMPEMDGYELTKQIKEDDALSHLPIILLTAKTQESDRLEALTVGADEYITKPFRLGDLQLRIDNIIANRQRIHRDSPVEQEEENESDSTYTTLDQEFLKRATECLNEHITDSDYDRDAFAADMGASASTLYNKLRSLTGMNVTAFIRRHRISTACQMAKDYPDLRVSDIAYRVGFKDPKYFATTFKKEMGHQPKEYFDMIRKVQSDSSAT